jgi:16S rRNA (adenine1518-N6/adenine1519-N6)-dimethyltransferase
VSFFHFLDSGELKKYTNSILAEYAITPKKKYGQHFVVNKSLIDEMLRISDIKEDETIVEIGGGIGTLTYFLLKRSNSVITYEIDPLLGSILKKEFFPFNDRLRIITNDFLSEELHPHEKLITNLPYSISSPFIWKISNLKTPPKLVVATLQEEFANHLCAKSGSKNYSRLSVYASYFYEFEIVKNFPAAFFSPKPKVSSSLVRGFTVNPPNIVKEKSFFQFLTSLFCRKHRKTRNNLRVYHKKLPKTDRKRFSTLLDTLEYSSTQTINLTPLQILDFYSDFRQIIEEEFPNINSREFME